MNVVAIGDIHGRHVWKEIVSEHPKADKFVFIGDYVDPYPHDKEATQITSRLIDNFEEILRFKRESPEQVVLLIGNHDYHYLPNCEAAYSRFDGSIARDMEEILSAAIKEGLVQVCFEAEGVLYSHAGFTKTWCSDRYVDMDNIEEFCNNLLLHGTLDYGFLVKSSTQDWSGDDVFQSPMWVRPDSLKRDGIDEYTQVVGHTQFGRVMFGDDIAFIDCLGHCKEYVEVIDGEINRRKL